MEFSNISRRKFVAGSLSTLAAASLPGRAAFGQTTIHTRLEWNDFKLTPGYASFINAIRAMRANTNSADRNSWSYWVNIHVRNCPHGIAYFLAWHRGYLHYFQETLRTISGDSTLTVPYWDYYLNPNMPAEFTDPSSGNPLYVADRVNTNVYSALSMVPFNRRYRYFQRGLTDAFETQVEPRPHGLFHNVVGGAMATKSSPLDPIFWLHHSQIDRFWVAWVAAGDGRTMPPPSDPYWTGSFTYGPLTMPRNRVYDTTTHLHYRYQNERFPTALPPQSSAGSLKRVQLQNPFGRGAPRRPAAGRFAESPPRAIGGNRRSIGGLRDIALDETSISAQVEVRQAEAGALEAVLGRSLAPGRNRPAPAPYNSVKVVLEDVRLTGLGARGGFYYDVYLNLPVDSEGEQERHLIGSFGPFEIVAHEHHPGSGHLEFSATQVLQDVAGGDMRGITVSFVRVNGPNFPRGRAVQVGEMRVELAPESN
jgi:tyrosinase